jgi:hypothetical protein
VDEDVAAAHLIEENQLGAVIEELDEVEWRISLRLSPTIGPPANPKISALISPLARQPAQRSAWLRGLWSRKF